MTDYEKFKAVEIITASNSPKVSFRVPVKDNYSNVHEILIHECNATLINQLIKEGFSLSMCEKGLSVSAFGIEKTLTNECVGGNKNETRRVLIPIKP